MNDYLFILGRDYELSMIELVSYLKRKDIQFNLGPFTEEYAIFRMKGFDAPQAIKELGGIVKIGKMIDFSEYAYNGYEKKVHYGISFYGSDFDVNEVEIDIKSLFKSQKLRVQYAKPKQGHSLTPSQVIKKDIVEKGVEFLVADKYNAITIACFDPFEHEIRDTKRPANDYLRTISIRLAKILINLSQAKKEILDPFCGYGILLQEALMMGLDAHGVDIEDAGVKASTKNMKWIQKRHNLKNKWSVMRGDARNLNVKPVECVASEPYLGPYMKKKPDLKAANRTMKELIPLYEGLMQSLSKVVMKNVAIIVPRFITYNKKEVVMPFEAIAKRYGFVKAGLMKDIELPIIYDNGNLLREIWVLNKKK